MLSIFILFLPLIASSEDIYLSDKFLSATIENPKITIAIMPIQNTSNKLEIDYHFRNRVAANLEAKGYSVIDSIKLDNALISLGIQNADQLDLISANDLKKLTSADYFMYGIIETANTQNAFIYNGVAYTASLLLQDAEKNDMWYSLSQRVAKRRFAIDPFNIILDFAISRGHDTNDSAIKYVADKLLETLPNGPSEVIVDDMLSGAIEIFAEGDK